MSHTAEAHSKYALPKFKSAASTQKRMRMLAFGGVGLVVVWMVALGAVAYKRNGEADAAAQAAAQTKVAHQAALVVAAAPAVRAPAIPAVAAIPAPARPEEMVKPAQSGAGSPRASRHSHHSSHTRARTFAARSGPSSSKAVASAAPSAKRMKDDQLDALLKQFK